MRLHSFKIKNFRTYKDEVEITFEDLTSIIGRNDSGKSTILEALDIFFNENKGRIKIDRDDLNKESEQEGSTELIFSACFSNLPKSLILDDSYPTNLEKEYLLNSDGLLEVIKKYNLTKTITPNTKQPIFIKAIHPTNINCKDLLSKKNTELQKIIKDNQISCENNSINSVMRSAIWNHYSNELELETTEIDVTKGDSKTIWDKLSYCLPLYSLFQSDRKNTDGDGEVQDPLKEAVKQIIAEKDIQEQFEIIAQKVKDKLEDVSNRTLDKVKEMNPEIASTLKPRIPSTEDLKWADIFKSVSITADNEIPINKRGSGVKRLILISFFRAEAERRRDELKIRNSEVANNNSSIIYAIEEPETSQHSEHQNLLIQALKEISQADNSQVIITTHSGKIVKQLESKQIRLIDHKNHKIVNIEKSILPYISLNEVNYLAFGEINEEYHNELYGHISEHKLLNEFEATKELILYNKICKNGNTEPKKYSIDTYIRHQIHHPENKHNERFTSQQLKQSIEDMRNFIITTNCNNEES